PCWCSDGEIETDAIAAVRREARGVHLRARAGCLWRWRFGGAAPDAGSGGAAACDVAGRRRDLTRWPAVRGVGRPHERRERSGSTADERGRTAGLPGRLAGVSSG